MPADSACLVIRTDASPAIGLGHFMRCLALAQAWIEMRGRAIFAMTEAGSMTEPQLRAIGASSFQLSALSGSLADAQETAALAAREGARWLVMDGYGFAPGYQQALRRDGRRVLLIDDDGRCARYETDLVLNQNVSAEESLYADRAAHTQLLLGPRHALLRQQFLASAPAPRTFPETARKVLVTLGGADPDNVTQTVIEALQSLPPESVEVVVVVGAANTHLASLQEASERTAAEIRLVANAANMPELMVWADVAISAAGSTTLELAYLGVPMLLLVLAENQAAIAERMHTSGAARSLGDARAATPAIIAEAIRELANDCDARTELSRVASALVDGHGARRVALALRGEPLSLRPARADDARLLFDWRNDPEVRAVSFDSKPIRWPDHERWFQARLASANAAILIAESAENQPAGVARFDVADGVATISISIAAAFRGRGWGRELIAQSSQCIFARPDVRQIRALAKPANTASARAFLAAGYREEASASADEPRVFLLDRADT